MEIDLYRNSSGNNVVSKKLTGKTTLSQFIWKNDSSIENPTFIISGISADDIVDFNYLYVPKWRRYYFINDWTVKRGLQVEMECSVDVLMSFQKAIKDSSQLLQRQESVAKGNAYLVDGELLMDNDVDIDVKNFGHSLSPDSNNYIIQIAEGSD